MNENPVLLPPPTYVVRDADGVTAMVPAWSTAEAVTAGRRTLTEHLGRAPRGNLSVYVKEA